jgi:hypothetical protein
MGGMFIRSEYQYKAINVQGPHFYNSVDCFIKSSTSAKSSEFAFNKIFILFNGISSIKSGLFNIVLLNKLFLREWLAVHFTNKELLLKLWVVCLLEVNTSIKQLMFIMHKSLFLKEMCNKKCLYTANDNTVKPV